MLAGVAAIGIPVAAGVRNPSVEGVAAGVFGGLLLGLVIMAAGAWAAMSIARPAPKIDTAAGDTLAAQLNDVLEELEAARLETVAAVNRRAMLRVPLCVGAGLGVIILSQLGDDPPDFIETICILGLASVGGYAWASLSLSSRYARLYKDKVLPRLASSFGALSYRQAAMPDLSRFKEECIFRKFDAYEADDEIFGMHRTRPINIVELKLTYGSGKNQQTMFDGLMVTLELPSDTGAITAVVTDAGGFGNFIDRQKGEHRERVRLEDPQFEKVYEVYSTDQIASRALLHPAFMEKLLALGALEDFSQPQVLCSGRILQIAMPKRAEKNLFEPPSLSKPAATRATLVALQKDIATVLAAADAVIGLDHRFEARGG